MKYDIDKVTYESITAPDLNHGGWMDVQIVIEKDEDKNHYTVAVNGFAPMRVKGSNNFVELSFLMGVLNEDKGALLKKMNIWAEEIIDAYKIVSANSMHWKELV